MKKVYFLIILFLFDASFTIFAQTLNVTGFYTNNSDLSASRFEKKDINGVPCGLIKVWLPMSDVKFVGNVIEYSYKNGEWWVYMTNGSKRITIKSSKYPPLSYEFSEPIQSKVTYKMTMMEETTPEFEKPKEALKKVDVVYYTKGYPKAEYSWEKELFAKVNGVEYSINVEINCINVVEQEDFDGNGIIDALIEENACGGNIGIYCYYIVSYSENGYFSISNSICGDEYSIEDWKGKKSILVYSGHYGVGNDEIGTEMERFVLKDGKLELVETLKKQLIASVKELRSSDFHQESEKPMRLSYDLDGNGITDYFECYYWERWGCMTIRKFVLNGKEVKDDDLHHSAKRIGVLSSITNGYHDLVIDEDEIVKWDGKKYVFPR